jgi:hypothetical protein
MLNCTVMVSGDNEAAAQPLPEGWSEAKDAQGRTYFWHTKTRKVQWERPTADAPAA